MAFANGQTVVETDLNNLSITTLTTTGAATVGGTLTTGSGAVQLTTAAGKIQALSSTYLDSLDGSNLTGLTKPQNRDVVVATVESTTDETTVYSYTIPGGTLGATQMLRGTVFLSVRSAASRTITLALTLGSTDVATHAIALGDTGGEVPCRFQFEISARNATNSQCVRAVSETVNSASNLTGTGTTVAAAQHLISVYAACAEDMTTDKALTLTVDLSAAEATLLTRVYAVQLELI